MNLMKNECRSEFRICVSSPEDVQAILRAKGTKDSKGTKVSKAVRDALKEVEVPYQLVEVVSFLVS
jgi:hypothetical protein